MISLLGNFPKDLPDLQWKASKYSQCWTVISESLSNFNEPPSVKDPQ